MRMRYKILLLTLFSMLSICLKAQPPAPSGFASPYSTSYYRIGWMQADSGNIFANRAPNFTPKFPFTVVGYLHSGVDTALWLWTGQTWNEIGKSGIGSLVGVAPIVVSGDTISCPTCGSGSGGINSLNGLTATTQTFSVGSSGSDFNIQSVGTVHTFNIPTASASNRGLLSTSDWSTFNGKQPQLNGTGFVKATGTTISYDNTSYYPSSNPSSFITLASLSAVAPATYNNLTGAIGVDTLVGNQNLATQGFVLRNAGTSVNGAGNLIPLFTTSIVSNTLTFAAQTVTAYAAYGNFTNTTTTPSFSKIPYQAFATASANNVLGFDGSGNPTILSAGTNISIATGSISTTANVTFTNLTATGVVKFTGLPSSGPNDSLLTGDPITGQVKWTSRYFTISAVEGVGIAGVDSFQLGTSLATFYKPDTIFTAGWPFFITGLPSKATPLSTDSAVGETLAGQLYKFPFTSGGSQTLQQVFTVQGNRAILTVADTLDATAADLRLIGNIVPSTNATSNIGNGTDNLLSVYTHQLNANNNMLFGIPTGDAYTFKINSVADMSLLGTGQLQLNQYTTISSFSVTAVGMLVFDASGNIGTAAISGGGGSPGGSNTDIQYNNSGAFGGNANATYNGTTVTLANDLLVHGLTVGLGLGSVTHNTAVGIGIFQSTPTGDFNTGLGYDALFAITTGAGNFGGGYLAGAATTTHSYGVYIGYQACRNCNGDNIVAIGDLALTNYSSGNDATAVGGLSQINATGYGNTSLGKWSLSLLSTGTWNTGIGLGAGSGDSTGVDNWWGGYLAGDLAATGSWNTITGAYGIQQQNHPFYNTTTGFAIGMQNTTVSDTMFTAMGWQVFGASGQVMNRKATIAICPNCGYAQDAHWYDDILVGDSINSASSDTSVTNVTVIGHGITLPAAAANLAIFGTASQQILLGNGGGTATEMNAFPNIAGALFYNITAGGWYFNNGSGWTAFSTGGGGVTTVGTFSASSQTNGATISGSTITFGPADGTNPGMISESAQTMGSGVKTFTSDAIIHGVRFGIGLSTGTGNTAGGNGALNTASTYNGVTAFGFDAGFNETGTGSLGNSFFGYQAGINVNGVGINNTFIGYQAGDQYYTGIENTIVGASAGFGGSPFTMSYTTFFGYNAGNHNEGNYNSGFGHSVLQTLTTGTYDLAFGTGVFSNMTTGNYNFGAGANTGNTLTTGSYEVLIGPWVDAASPTESDTLRIVNGLIGIGLSSPTALYSTPVSTFKLGIAMYPLSSAVLTLPATTTTVSSLNVQPSSAILMTTPVNGAFENDGSNVFVTTNGVRQRINPVIFTATANGSAVTNAGTSFTNFIGTGTGSLTIAANTLQVGQTVTIHGYCTVTTPALTPGLSISFGIGSVAGGSVNLATPSSLSGIAMEYTAVFTILTTGSSGTASYNLTVAFSGSAPQMAAFGTVTGLNTTTSETVSAQVAWGATSPSGASVQGLTGGNYVEIQ
jgi:hypothetical protein